MLIRPLDALLLFVTSLLWLGLMRFPDALPLGFDYGLFGLVATINGVYGALATHSRWGTLGVVISGLLGGAFGFFVAFGIAVARSDSSRGELIGMIVMYLLYAIATVSGAHVVRQIQSTRLRKKSQP